MVEDLLLRYSTLASYLYGTLMPHDQRLFTESSHRRVRAPTHLLGLRMAKPCAEGQRFIRLMELDRQNRRCWLAAYTRSRHEQHVANQLQMKNLEFLLPTYQHLARWSDRIKRSEAPLFPGYIFVHASDRERVPVLETMGVVYLVSIAGKPAVLPDEDVERLRTCALRSGDVEPHPYLRIGHRVRVKHGPFAGWEGTLVEKQNSFRLVIAIDQILRSVAVNLHGADLESLD